MMYDWTEPKTRDDGSKYLDVPDDLMPLFNKVGFQLRLHTITGKGEVETVASIVYLAQKFFTCEKQNPPTEASVRTQADPKKNLP